MARRKTVTGNKAAAKSVAPPTATRKSQRLSNREAIKESKYEVGDDSMVVNTISSTEEKGGIGDNISATIREYEEDPDNTTEPADDHQSVAKKPPISSNDDETEEEESSEEKGGIGDNSATTIKEYDEDPDNTTEPADDHQSVAKKPPSSSNDDETEEEDCEYAGTDSKNERHRGRIDNSILLTDGVIAGTGLSLVDRNSGAMADDHSVYDGKRPVEGSKRMYVTVALQSGGCLLTHFVDMIGDGNCMYYSLGYAVRNVPNLDFLATQQKIRYSIADLVMHGKFRGEEVLKPRQVKFLQEYTRRHHWTEKQNQTVEGWELEVRSNGDTNEWGHPWEQFLFSLLANRRVYSVQLDTEKEICVIDMYKFFSQGHVSAYESIRSTLHAGTSSFDEEPIMVFHHKYNESTIYHQAKVNNHYGALVPATSTPVSKVKQQKVAFLKPEDDHVSSANSTIPPAKTTPGSTVKIQKVAFLKSDDNQKQLSPVNLKMPPDGLHATSCTVHDLSLLRVGNMKCDPDGLLNVESWESMSDFDKLRALTDRVEMAQQGTSSKSGVIPLGTSQTYTVKKKKANKFCYVGNAEATPTRKRAARVMENRILKRSKKGKATTKITSSKKKKHTRKQRPPPKYPNQVIQAANAKILVTQVNRIQDHITRAMKSDPLWPHFSICVTMCNGWKPNTGVGRKDFHVKDRTRAKTQITHFPMATSNAHLAKVDSILQHASTDPADFDIKYVLSGKELLDRLRAPEDSANLLAAKDVPEPTDVKEAIRLKNTAASMVHKLQFTPAKKTARR